MMCAPFPLLCSGKLTFGAVRKIHDDEGTHTSTMVAGRIRRFHVRKDLFGPTGAIDPARLLPIARLGGISYARVTDAYEAPRPVWSDYLASQANMDSAKKQ